MRSIVCHPPTPEEWVVALDNEKLLNRYVRIIRTHLDHEMFSFEDLKSWGWEGLLRAVQDWDPLRGTFATHAWFCVRSAVSRGVRDELSQRGKALKRARRLSQEEAAAQVSLEELVGIPAEETEDNLDLYRAISLLPDPEHDVLVLHYFGTPENPEGMTTREVGAALGLSHAGVQKILRRALHEMRETLDTLEEAAA